MGYLFFDDSKHERRGGFCLGALVYTRKDPTLQINGALRRHGLRPGFDEFKSSYKMAGDANRISLREDLRALLRGDCRLGVAVVREPSDLGRGGFELMAKARNHPALAGKEHRAYFDQGMFSSRRSADQLASTVAGLEPIELHPEQDSSKVAGIQLADLAAHTCAMMLLETLGLVNKTTKAGDNSGYDPDTDINLGFELWAGIRYNFLATPPPPLDEWDTSEEQPQPIANVKPFGLHAAEDLAEDVRSAAIGTFGSMYLGCTH